MKVKKFGNHGNGKGHVITSRIVCGRKVNKRVSVKKVGDCWIGENGFDYTIGIAELRQQ